MEDRKYDPLKVTKLDEDELIEIALSSDEPIDMGPANQADEFIKELQVEEDENGKVHTRVIWEAFLRWYNGDPKQQWTKARFFRTFKKQFKQGHDNYINQRFYYLNEEPFKELIEEFKNNFELRHRHGAKKGRKR